MKLIDADRIPFVFSGDSEEFSYGVSFVLRIIEEMSEVETIYGYRIEDLVKFAEACRKAGVEAWKLHILLELLATSEGPFHVEMPRHLGMPFPTDIPLDYPDDEREDK